MDFFTALLDSQFSETSLLKPRLPARFEPHKTQTDAAFLAEVSEIQPDDSPHLPTQTPTRPTVPTGAEQPTREHLPYRGAMNLVLPSRGMDASETIPSTRDNPQRTLPPAFRPTSASHAEDAGENEVVAHTAENSNVSSIRPAPNPDLRAAGASPKSILQDIETSPAAPVVHIHIGRIVVRAVATPTPEPSKPVSQSKKMSLDDYLKKSAGGER